MPPEKHGETWIGEDHPLRVGLRAAATTGTLGFIVGGTFGIWRSPRPTLQAIGSSIQFGLCGGLYFGIRSAIIQSGTVPQLTPTNAVLVSAASGVSSFSLAGAIVRGRRGIIPGAVIGAFLASSGQLYMNWVEAARRAQEELQEEPEPIVKRVLKSKWSPLQIITDEEHASMLEEKALKAEAEIAVIDEELKKLQQSSSSESSVDTLQSKSSK